MLGAASRSPVVFGENLCAEIDAASADGGIESLRVRFNPLPGAYARCEPGH